MVGEVVAEGGEKETSKNERNLKGKKKERRKEGRKERKKEPKNGLRKKRKLES
jgi:hypothetical protein